MRLYETTFVISTEISEEDRDALLDRVKEIVTSNGGEVVEEDRWGVKKMAYEINKQRTGFYTVLKFKGEPDLKDELERNFRIMDNILRYIIIRLDE